MSASPRSKEPQDGMSGPSWLKEAVESVNEALDAKNAIDRISAADQIASVLAECGVPVGAGKAQAAIGAPSLDRLVAAAMEGNRGGWYLTRPDPTVAIHALRAVVEDGASRTTEREVVSAVPALVRDLERTLAVAWRTHVNETVGGVEDIESLKRILSRLPGQVKAVAGLASAQQDVGQLRDSLPDEAANDRLKATASKVEQAFRKAVGDTDVREFLIASARSGAPLSMLANGDTVWAWLQANGALDYFQVQPRLDS